MRKLTMLVAALVMVGTAASTRAADVYGLEKGSPELSSVGSLTFGPEDILFVADPKAAAIVAVRTGEKAGDANATELNVADLQASLNEAVGGKATLVDLAVNPRTGTAFLAVTSPKGPALVRVGADGRASHFALQNVPSASVTLPDAPADAVTGQGRRRRNLRMQSITDMAFVDGRLLVSGLRNGDAPSSVREIRFPFEAELSAGTSLEIYHAAHGRSENYAPIGTFVPFNVDGEATILAGFVCTPLVRVDLSKLAPGMKIKGTTVAELGNRNRPLDMFAYEKDGGRYLLLANSARGVMKISTDGLAENTGLTERVGGGGTAGQKYDTIESLKGVVQMDRLGDEHAVVVMQTNAGLTLKTVPLP